MGTTDTHRSPGWISPASMRRLAAAGLLAVLAAAGGSAAAGENAASRAPEQATATSPWVSDVPAADPDAPGRILTPGQDVPNPFVLHERGTYYLYSTQENWLEPNVPLRSGPSMDELGPPREVMPKIPTWAEHGLTWAPDVRHVGGRYVLWFTARMKEGRSDGAGTQCIGVAVGERPEGPFTPLGDEPQVCQLDRWGSIDPRTFVDRDGSLWLHWKSDDNAEPGVDTKSTIYARRLADDGVTFIGNAIRVLEVDKPWEGRIIEAPHMIEAAGAYWLFYSGNWFNQPDYSIGWARCDGPAGPCTKPPNGPWLASNAQGEGPGESSMFLDDEGWWIVYAPAAVVHRRDTPRPVAMAAVEFGPDGPYLADRSVRMKRRMLAAAPLSWSLPNALDAIGGPPGEAG